MANISNSFRFTGEYKSVKEGLREINSKNNPKWSGRELTFSIKNSTGSQQVRLFGGKTEGKGIITFSKDKDEKGKSVKLEIPFSKRLDKAVIDSVANFKKFKILDEEFITELDVIDYLEENLLDLEGKRVTVTGNVEFDVYKGKIYQKYYVSNIFEARDEVKDGFKGNLAVFLTPNTISEDYLKGKSVNFKLIENDGKLPLNVYIEQYNKDKSTREEKPYLYIPITTFINIGDKFDFENVEHMKKLKFRVGLMAVKKGIHEIGMSVTFFRGQEETEITEDDLTNFEKSQIEAGVKTFDEIVKGKQGYGNFKEEIQLLTPHSAYVDGLVETELIDENLEDISYEEDEVETKPEAVVEELDEDDDLFS